MKQVFLFLYLDIFINKIDCREGLSKGVRDTTDGFTKTRDQV